ncbi:type VI secretion system protein TssA [Azohydromonas aeria]|uniref:type VI secretion system protein TssA n=1 Tax=Azohydromonas aeria TaxID=2590212 RepID=UPI0012FB8491|nr:type VI secretion system protein TssA [Azohydromonas aeria]
MDLEPFLAPLSAEAPCGADLSFAPELDVLRELRREDDPTLEQGAWVAPLKSADWPGVARGCEALLRTRSRDLAVAGWLAEAWARLRGFAGLADGLDLAAALVERHWDALHPLPDGDDFEARSGCLAWLAARVADLSARLPLAGSGAEAFNLLDVEAARQHRREAEAGPEPVAAAARDDGGAGDAGPTLESLLRTAGALGRDGFTLRLEAITAAAAALQRLQAAVDERLARDGPSFAAARAALERAAEGWARLGREAGVIEAGLPAGDAAAAPAAAAASAVAPTPAALSGPIRSRAQALQQLRLVADYFRQAEPHSPVAYLADKAARWGEMPLHEWLRAVVKDGGALAAFEEMLGVEPRESRG